MPRRIPLLSSIKSVLEPSLSSSKGFYLIIRALEALSCHLRSIAVCCHIEGEIEALDDDWNGMKVCCTQPVGALVMNVGGCSHFCL